MEKDIIILGIESSCDDTSAAVIRNGVLLSNVIASQKVHEEYGGVVPELASRAHQQNIVPVVDTALRRAGVDRKDLSAIAFTRGPGLLGSLLVGVSFAKGLALSLGVPMVEVNHLQGHVLAHFVREGSKGSNSSYLREAPDDRQSRAKDSIPLCPVGTCLRNSMRATGSQSQFQIDPQAAGNCFTPTLGEESKKEVPEFPFLCLLVSGGNSQIVLLKAYNDMEIIGQTIDDAAGEAFDKCAKVLGLPYPGGPWIDRLAKQGNPEAFVFAKPQVSGYNYSFSGLKTSFLYTLRDLMIAHGVNTVDELAEQMPNLREDLCASLQKTVVEILMKQLRRAAKEYKINTVAVAGGVSANSGLRAAFEDYGKRYRAKVFIPPFSFTTDNAAMIAEAGYWKYQDGDFCPIDAVPYAKTRI